jgi:hypothetical protein
MPMAGSERSVWQLRTIMNAAVFERRRSAAACHYLKKDHPHSRGRSSRSPLIVRVTSPLGERFVRGSYLGNNALPRPNVVEAIQDRNLHIRCRRTDVLTRRFASSRALLVLVLEAVFIAEVRHPATPAGTRPGEGSRSTGLVSEPAKYERSSTSLRREKKDRRFSPGFRWSR